MNKERIRSLGPNEYFRFVERLIIDMFVKYGVLFQTTLQLCYSVVD